MAVKMPFGKFKGLPLEKVPDAYLTWLSGEVSLREPLLSGVRRELESRAQCHGQPVVTLDMNRVKAIYRDLARQYHPDRIGGAGGIMQGINLFYEAISQ